MGFAGGLTFSETTKQVKATLEDSIITTDFAFTNKTDKAIEIQKCQASCSCLQAGVAGGKLRYEPGESGVIRTKFDMGASTGEVEKQVAIFVDDDRDTAPSTTLKLDVLIPEIISIEPKTVKWDIDAPATPQTLVFTIPGADPIHLKNAGSTNPNFKSDLKTVEDGRKYELVITPVDTKTTTVAVFRIDSDCKIEKHRVQQVYAVVKPAGKGEPKPAAR